ncbi:MAG: hypothetical protein J6N52_10930 [Clostridia bacterium]|nr:hypothetical protein [Clostridia bacterium]
MRTALIDIGSNTIRFVAYQQDRQIENFAEHAGLIADVSGGRISPAGISKLVKALTAMNKRAAELECDTVYAFATASLRNIEDKRSLSDYIRSVTGTEIDFISGEQEAMYDFAGLRSMYNESSGAAFDLGGGSCQLIYYERDKVCEFKSLPIGSLKLYTAYVNGEIPTEEEKSRIARRVRIELSKLALLKQCGADKLYAMGGAGFALAKVSAVLFGGDGKRLSCQELEKIAGVTAQELLSIVPKRVRTAIPAAVTMIEILKFTGAAEIEVTEAGVRDGILHSRFL